MTSSDLHHDHCDEVVAAASLLPHVHGAVVDYVKESHYSSGHVLLKASVSDSSMVAS